MSLISSLKITVAKKHKFIREFDVTNASVYDSGVVKKIIDHDNSGEDLRADSAYIGQEISDALEAAGLKNCINEKSDRNRPLTEEQKAANREKSKIRSRVEHVFYVQSQRAGRLLLRTQGVFVLDARSDSRRWSPHSAFRTINHREGLQRIQTRNTSPTTIRNFRSSLERSVQNAISGEPDRIIGCHNTQQECKKGESREKIQGSSVGAAIHDR